MPFKAYDLLLGPSSDEFFRFLFVFPSSLSALANLDIIFCFKTLQGSAVKTKLERSYLPIIKSLSNIVFDHSLHFFPHMFISLTLVYFFDHFLDGTTHECL